MNFLYKSMLILTTAIVVSACADYQKTPKPAYTLNEIIYADRLENNDYELTLNGNENWDIFTGTSVKTINWSTPTPLSPAQKSVVITNSKANNRLFFAAVNRKDTLFISEREIDLEKAFNFRDIGGIPTTDGKHTKWGMVYRSGEIAKLSDADLATLKSLNLKTILDLRSHAEIEDKPDMYPDDVTWKHLPIGDLGDQNMEKMKEVISNADPETFDGDELMEKMSVQFIGSTDRFKTFFETLLADNKTPLLFHCTAGKDRTGFSSAFLLYALGADKQTILDEYELSNYFRHDSNEDMIEKAAKFYGLDQRILRAIMGVKSKWLEKGFHEIDKQYGSFDNYLMEIGVDSTALTQLRMKFLE